MEELFEEYRQAITAVEERIAALRQTWPNARGEEYLSIGRRIAALEDEREDLFFALRGMGMYLRK